MDLGLHRAGFDHVAFCESDPYRREVLARHWPGVPVHDDVRTFDYDGQVDCLVGGFPCQDLSIAGSRKGLAGERSGLFYEFARIADKVVRPGGAIIIENVPGLLSSDNGRDMARVLRTLSDLGFSVGYRTLDSRYFRVPQRRRRVFIVGIRSESISPGEILGLTKSGERNPEETRQARKNDLARNVSPPKKTRGFVGGFYSDVAGCVTKHQAKGQNSTLDDGALVIADGQIRKLTPVECERLQGWPDGWTLTDGPSLADTPRWFEDEYVPNEDCPRPNNRRYAACGDGVTATVSEWLGKRIRAAV